MIVSTLAGLLLTKVAVIPLSDGVKQADRIVIGRVSRVVTTGGHRFADVTVERTLKGASTPSIRFLAEPIWTCDISGAELGERAIFLMNRLTIKSAWIENSVPLTMMIEQSGTIYGLSHSGSGKIPITSKGIEAYFYRDGFFVINNYELPKGLKPNRPAIRDTGWLTLNQLTASIQKMM